MHSDQLLPQLVKAKDQAQYGAKILGVAKICSSGRWTSAILYYSHVAAVKDPEDRRPCLTPAATEKNSASMFTKKSDYLRSTQKFTWWVMESGTTVDLWLPSIFVKVGHFV